MPSDKFAGAVDDGEFLSVPTLLSANTLQLKAPLAGGQRHTLALEADLLVAAVTEWLVT